MKGFRSLSTRLVVAILVPLAALLLGATWLETRSASRAMIATAETAAVNLGGTVREELQGVMRSTKAATEALAIPLARLDAVDPTVIEGILTDAVARNVLIYGTALAMEPRDMGSDAGNVGGAEALAPYVYRTAQGPVVTDLSRGDYRYWTWPWFTVPLESGTSHWSDPYFDDGAGDARMVTYSVPLAIAGRRAVLTSDLELGFLSRIAASNLLGRPGVVFVFDRGGRIVAHPEESWLLQRTLADIAADQGFSDLDRALRAVTREEALWIRPEDGMHEGLVGGSAERGGRLLVIPLKEAGWGIGVYFSDEDFLADVQAVTRVRLLFTLGLILLLAGIITFVSRRGVRPLQELATRTRAIARGEFKGETPGLERRDEIGRMSRAFHQMQDQLQDYVHDLTRATAERERMDAELTTARLLQHALLPSERPAMEETGTDLAASLRSAQAVGGDLFNYQRLDERRLFFVIGDVSDEGVPAALFMTRVNALLKSIAGPEDAPEDVLVRINRSLGEENELCMFATLIVGILDLDSGQLRLASAGHAAPLRVSADGHVEAFALTRGDPVGLDTAAEFAGAAFDLAPGDSVVAYTDGLPGASNAEGEAFGRARLEHALGEGAALTAADQITAVLAAVESFADGADLGDDLSLLVVRWSPTL